MPDIEFSKEDAHSRVAILFTIPADELNKETFVAVSVKWLLVHGHPVDIATGVRYPYKGTFIIQ